MSPRGSFIGAKDQWTSVEYSEKMVDALKENGSNVKSTGSTLYDAWKRGLLQCTTLRVVAPAETGPQRRPNGPSGAFCLLLLWLITYS